MCDIETKRRNLADLCVCVCLFCKHVVHSSSELLLFVVHVLNLVIGIIVITGHIGCPQREIVTKELHNQGRIYDDKGFQRMSYLLATRQRTFVCFFTESVQFGDGIVERLGRKELGSCSVDE